MIYLDNAATTPVAPEVFEVMQPYLTERYGNPGSLHSPGRAARKAVENARAQVADLIGAQPGQVVFTSGGSEANSLALLGVLPELMRRGRLGVLSDRMEHDSVLCAIRAMQERCGGLSVGYAGVTPVDARGVSLTDLARRISERTGLVSVMYVNNETGAINPVNMIGELCRRYGALFHTDCVQAAGMRPICAPRIGCDFLSISSHKLHGPQGVGALYVRDAALISPLICGGAAQEFGLRGGTENVAGIVGFGAACAIASRYRAEHESICTVHKHRFYSALRAELEKLGSGLTPEINGPPISAPGRILNLRFDGVDAETLVLLADANGLCISAGSACRSHEQEANRTLLAMGLTPEQARCSVRISFSAQDQDETVREAARILARCVLELRR